VRIEFLGHAGMDKIFQPVLEGLRDEGHDVHRHPHASDAAAGTISPDVDVLVAFGGIKFDRGILSRFPKLRALISPVTGTEGFDESAATELGIVVANGQIVENYTGMAEATIMLMLAALYDLHGTERVLREDLPRPQVHAARMLMGKTVGLIGFGQIAKAVAERLQAWHCNILASVRTPRPLPDRVSPVSLDVLLRTSDVVVVLSSLNAETRGMLGAAELASMKEDVVFINVSRGGIVDEQALAALALARPRMRLAVDVFERLPVEKDHPLRQLPNAILTPHMVGHTIETHQRLPIALLANIHHAMAGTPPEYIRNPQVLPRWSARLSSLTSGQAQHVGALEKGGR
jgi:D-3-phosphoglycerate dehydrogenase